MAEEGICVAIRMRPLNSREKIQGQNTLWRCLPAYNSITQTNPDGSPMPDRNPGFTFFTYDKAFGEESTTQAVYEAVGRPIVQSVLQGFNGTVFAYGQTSSGKTHTMVGDGEADGEEGMLHLAARDIFHLISETHDRDFLLRVSYVEIYNETIRDLLDPETPALSIREDPRKGVYIEASESIITDFDSILNALKTGSKNRRVEATAMNERSSRSHTIFRMVLESKERRAFSAAVEGAEPGADADVDGAVLVATLNLVDLAGSESVRHTGATGNRAKEGGKINQSLLTLSRVIHALGQEGSGHIGFRDSKLTRILQPSLSGNAKMAVVCCITPAERYLEETRSTLQFASRAKMVKTRAVVNEVLDDRAQLKRLKKELQELKERQQQLESGGAAVSLEDVSRLEAERQLMSGKVEQLEAERHEQANKIDRLTHLILKGGPLMAQASDDSIRATGRQGRRGKRLRETWCPGEMKDLPPGAALRSLQALVEDDEADDRLVSNLSFGKISKRRGGSSVSQVSEAPGRFSTLSGSDDVSGAMMDDSAFKSDDPDDQHITTPMHATEDAASAAQLAEIRAILSAMGGEEEGDVVSLVKALADSLAKQREAEQPMATDACPSGVEQQQQEVEAVGMAMEDRDSGMRALQAAHEEALQQAHDEAATLRAQVEEATAADTEKALPQDLLRSLATVAGMEGEDLPAPSEVMSAAVETIGRLKGQVDSAAKQQAALELHANGMDALRMTLSAQVEALQAQVMSVGDDTDKVELEDKVRELQEGNAHMAAALQEAQEQRLRDVAALEEQLAAMQAEKRDADARGNDAVAEVERLTGELQAAGQRQAEIEEQVRTTQDAVAQLAAERDGLVAQVESLSGELERAKDEAAGVEAELREQLRRQQDALTDAMAQSKAADELQAQIAAQEEVLAQASSANEHMAEEQRMLCSEVEALRTELDTARQQATATLEAATGEAEQLRARVDELTRQLEEREQALASLEERQQGDATTVEFLTAEASTYREETERLSTHAAAVTLAVRHLCDVLQADTQAPTQQEAELEEDGEVTGSPDTATAPVDVETLLTRATQAAQQRAAELTALQAQVTAIHEQLLLLQLQQQQQQQASASEEGEASSTAVSRASLVRQSMGGRTSLLPAGPPQPLLDELRLKLGKNREAEEEVVEVEEEGVAMEEVTIGMEGVAMDDQTIELPAHVFQDTTHDEEDKEEEEPAAPETEAVRRASRGLSLCPSLGGLFHEDEEQEQVVQEQEAPVAPADADVEALRSRVVQLESMIAQLTMDLTGGAQEVEKLQAALSATQDEVATSREAAVAKEEELRRLAEQLAEAQGHLAAAEGSLPAEEAAALANDVEQLRAQVTALVGEKEAAEAEAVSLTEQLATTAREAQSLQERLVSEGAVAEKLVQDLEDEIAACKAQVDALTQSVATLNGERDAAAAASEAYDAATLEMAALQERLAERDMEVATAQQRMQELEAQLSSTPTPTPTAAEQGTERLHSLLLNEQNARQEAENSLASLQCELSDAKAALRRLQDQQDEATSAHEATTSGAKKEVERLLSELAVAEAEAKTLREQVHSLTAELGSTREELVASRSVVTDTESDDAGLRKRLSQLQTMLDLTEGRATKHEARVRELEAELQAFERSADGVQEQTRREMEVLEKQASKHDHREGELAALRDACTAMSSKVEALKAERDEATERASRAADAVDALEKELSELRGASTQKSPEAADEMASLKTELEQARSEAVERGAEASQMQVRLRRAQQEVEAMSHECASAREAAEQMREKLSHAQQAVQQVEQLTQEAQALRAQVEAGAQAVSELEPLRQERERMDEETRCLQRGMEVMEGHLEAERLEVQSLQGQVTRLNSLLERHQQLVADVQARLEAAEQEASGKAEAAKEAEAAKALLIEEMNTLSFAECDARTLAEQKEEEVKELKQALEQARSASSSTREESAAVLEDLRAQLAQKDRDYDAVHGDNYRMKRELSELREAAENAEEAITAHTQQMDKLSEQLRGRCDEVTRLEASLETMKRDLEAKDKRIQHLDRSKLTVEQVERIQKLKKDHQHALEENAKLKQDLTAAQQALHDVSKSGADDTVAETLEVQSNTITELMALRENLTAKLRRAQDNCRKLEVERTSVFESLRELPSESLCFDQVPEDLSVAVNMLIEKYITEVAESRKESLKGQGDRNTLIAEVNTLTEEKDVLKRKVQELQQSLTVAEVAQEKLKDESETGAEQAAGAEAKVRQLQAAHDAAQQEANNSIRFLEKENLELMMEIKDLKTRILKLQTEVDTLRSTGGGPSAHMTPSTGLSMGNSNVLDRPSASHANVTKRHSSSSTKAAPSVLPKSYAAAMHDKENAIGAAVNMLRGVSGDDTAPPFRSINDEDEDPSASAQCKQS